MAIIDDVIGVFSPGWKAARLRSRALIMAYEAVKPTGHIKPGGKIALLISSVNTVRFPCGSRPVFWISIMTW